MYNTIHWITKNRTLFITLASLVLIPLFSVLLWYAEWGIISILLVDLLLWLVISVYAQNCHLVIVRRTLKTLNDKCDPYPMLNEMEILLRSKHNEMARIPLVINYCVALRNVGEYEDVYAILSQNNIASNTRFTPQFRLIYCNNMADICALTDRREEGLIYVGKARALITELKGKRLSPWIPSLESNARVLECKMTGDYEGMLSALDSAPTTTLENRVETAFCRAEAYMALGDRENARKELTYVITNGNRLHSVTVSRSKLTELDKEATDVL